MEEKLIEISYTASKSDIKEKLKFETDKWRNEGGVMEKVDEFLAGFSSVGANEKVIFYRLLSTLINAWVPLLDSLEVLQSQVKSQKLALTLKNVGRRVSSGSMLSDALWAFPEIFENAECWVIKAWEKSGKLKDILINLADQIEKSFLISSKIKWAMIYPIVILLVVSWALYWIMVFVIPQIEQMFTSMWAKLPWITTFIIDCSRFLTSSNSLGINNWISLIAWIAFVVILFFVWKKQKSWAYWVSIVSLRLPVFGQLVQKMAVAKFCWAMSLLVWSWLPIIDSLKLSSEMIWSEAYRVRILMIVVDVKQWLSIAQNMKKDTVYFPTMLTSMILVWEKTAQIPEVTKKVAEFYEDEVDSTVRNLMQLLEPIIIVVVWAIVAVIVIAVMLPLLSLSDIATWWGS